MDKCLLCYIIKIFKEEFKMTTDGIRTLLIILCVLAIVCGLIGGIFVGQALRTPQHSYLSDDDSFFDVYGQGYELKWTVASTIGMIATWISGITLGVILYAISACLKSLDIIHRSFYELRKSQNKEKQPQPKLFKDTEA